MKHLFLSILLVVVLVTFGYCFLLAGQAVLSIFKAHALQAANAIQSVNCTITPDGTKAVCKTVVRF